MEKDDEVPIDFIESNKNLQVFENFLKFYFEGGYDPKPEPVKRICEENIDDIVDEFYKDSKGYDWLDE